ncbi:MAG: metallophosphoesterase, partial [Anaerotignum sp.]|nr:metallophosphoesterase [Anaerotignum sp.]
MPFDYSKETPVEFQNPDSVKLTFACIADTHLIDKESATANLENFFTDVFSANKPFDAVMLAGDISEYGKRAEYRRFFNVFDKYQKKVKIFLTMGN